MSRAQFFFCLNKAHSIDLFSQNCYAWIVLEFQIVKKNKPVKYEEKIFGPYLNFKRAFQDYKRLQRFVKK